MSREKFLTQFVNLVAELRQEQQKFFATKQQVHLVNCKKLEKQVDSQIKEFKLNGAPESAAHAQTRLEL